MQFCRRDTEKQSFFIIFSERLRVSVAKERDLCVTSAIPVLDFGRRWRSLGYTFRKHAVGMEAVPNGSDQCIYGRNYQQAGCSS